MSSEDINEIAGADLSKTVDDSVDLASTEKKQDQPDGAECINYFELDECDEPEIPIDDGTPEYHREVQNYLTFLQIQKALKLKHVITLEKQLKKLYQNSGYWYEDYLGCIIVMRDNSLRYCNDEIIDLIELLNNFVLQEL